MKQITYEEALAKLNSGDWDNERFNDAIMDGEVKVPKKSIDYTTRDPERLTVEELRERCKLVWPDEVWEEGYVGEGVTDIIGVNGIAIITWQYVDDGPRYRWHTRHFTKGMRRRPQALAYLEGKRDDFYD